MWCEVPGEGGWREEWRSEEEVEKQSPGASEFNRESEGGTGLTQAEPVGSSVREGTLGGKGSRAHSGEPMSLSGLKDCLGVGLFGGTAQPLGSLVLPQSQPSAEGFRASGRQALQGPH